MIIIRITTTIAIIIIPGKQKPTMCTSEELLFYCKPVTFNEADKSVNLRLFLGIMFSVGRH